MLQPPLLINREPASRITRVLFEGQARGPCGQIIKDHKVNPQLCLIDCVDITPITDELYQAPVFFIGKAKCDFVDSIQKCNFEMAIKRQAAVA